ncbi:hypothetical protein PVAP13_8NG091402 [Panicum virgatum]|uniref:Uncharacterized protein n=1 Tax=Panicum virgatum TaxID=38727 RepID=A0A8T0P234_PANVG|nr:hypothetical protein PVAP13_8NG091402 [Panicum virgatum]
MVTRIALRKTSIVSSDRAIQGGELARLKKVNERMTSLVKTLEDLKISLQKENQVLKEGYAEKSKVVEKLVKSHEDHEKVIENLRKLVEEDEKQVSELRKQIKVKDEVLAKAAEEVEKVELVCSEMVAKSEAIFQAYKKALAAFGGEPLPLPPAAKGPEGVLRL